MRIWLPFLLALLTTAPALVLAQSVPICPVADGYMGPVVSEWEYTPTQPRDLTSCNARPNNRKLLSPECPTCPLIWVYPIHDGNGPGIFKFDLQEAAKIWNDALGWNVIGVETGYVTMENVPTYGVTIRRHNGYTMPTSASAGYWAGHTANIDSALGQRCYRDDLRISTRELDHRTLVTVIAHEMGHALMRAEGWHSDDHRDLLYEYSFGGYNRRISPEVKRLLNEYTRKPVLDGRMSLPCALRGLGC